MAAGEGDRCSGESGAIIANRDDHLHMFIVPAGWPCGSNLFA